MRLNKCKRCEKVKPYWEFTKKRDTYTKLAINCKVCMSERARERYHKDIDKAQAYYREKWHERVHSDRSIIRIRLKRRLAIEYGFMSAEEVNELVGGLDEAIDYLLAALPSETSIRDVTIDHIIPLKAARGNEQMKKKVCHYTNLQWLTRRENCSKQADMPAICHQNADA